LVEEIMEEKWEDLGYYDYENLKYKASSAALLQTQNNEKGLSGVELEKEVLMELDATFDARVQGSPGLTEPKLLSLNGVN
jgi:hypothetical protein